MKCYQMLDFIWWLLFIALALLPVLFLLCCLPFGKKRRTGRRKGNTKRVKGMQIVINGLKWKVFNAEPDSPKLKDSKDIECFGITSFPSLTIWLRNDQAPELYRQTVIHELVHAYTFSFGVHLYADEGTEESVCDFFGATADKIITHADLIMEKLYGKG